MDISVIIPTYNRKALLKEALFALKAQNTRYAYEVIVACDACTDGTQDMLRYLSQFMPWLRFLDLPKGGPARARNAAAALAQAPVLAFTDDDCMPTKTWIQSIGDAMKEGNVLGIQGVTHTYRKLVTPLTHQIENLHGHSAVPTCNAAFSKEAFQRVGGFDERFPYPHNEDADLAWRIGAVAFVPEMEVVHPPRPVEFSQAAGRMRVLESEFLLFYKNPEAYKKYRRQSPWKTIYWEVFVIHQLRKLKSCFKHSPWVLAQGVALNLYHWASLLWLYPAYRKAEKLAQQAVS